jgi:hypothetical protein
MLSIYQSGIYRSFVLFSSVYLIILLDVRDLVDFAISSNLEFIHNLLDEITKKNRAASAGINFRE